MSRNAWVTLATTDGYAVGALVLANSLRAVGTRHNLHVLYTDGVSQQLRQQLHSTFTEATQVNVLDSNDQENLGLIGRPDLGVTFTKLHCWRLTQYEKCVFLDADTLVIQNSDELFDRPDFSAAPDIGWPDFFNSGVFVFAPSMDTYRALVQFGIDHGTFDGGDQGLLNQFYPTWREWDASHRLPFVYNVTSGAIYSYAAAIKRHGHEIKIVHFLGQTKPWHSVTTGVHDNVHWAKWQHLYEQHVKPALPEHLLVGFLADAEAADNLAVTNEPKQPTKHSSVAVHLWYGHAPASQLHRHHHKKGAAHHHSEHHRHDPPPPPPEHRPSSPPQNAPHTSAHQPPSDHFEQKEVNTPQESSWTPQGEEWPAEGRKEEEEKEASSGTLNEQHRNDWERGAPDYQGRDAFDKIMEHIQSQL
ncbi:hypothetical protein M3Y99_01293300 [Aphelenchoides fujianensis]|nr:hypothetical protein M3Y99_01293300 [Aphelenchoides fujianensis]